MPSTASAPQIVIGNSITPKSNHTSDPALQPFLGPTFDPTAYLNNTLPTLAIPTPGHPIPSAKAATLADLTTQTQSHLTQLSALSARLTATLAALTDDILRSGSRLAYDVELLRGEANALAESLTESLAPDIETFVPGGVTLPEAKEERDSTELLRQKLAQTSVNPHPDDSLHPNRDTTANRDSNGTPESAPPPAEPQALTRLRTLHHIRARLQTVISTFDAALSWPLPPSATSSAASNLISVSAPSSSLHAPPTPSSTLQSLEAKGQAAQQALRDSVAELLSRDAGAEGVLAAERRVEELRELVGVWRGTGEEKVRLRFVEGLGRMVAERRREEEGRGALKRREGDVEGVETVGREERERDREKERGKGLFGGLRRLREEIYLE